ncbi:hypothetical protein B0H13DRAFT_2380127 [Mycena leptocephala]|nr:hypothetical protein B0H13DRAFT_2380127 [Mycena leptocephala]
MRRSLWPTSLWKRLPHFDFLGVSVLGFEEKDFGWIRVGSLLIRGMFFREMGGGMMPRILTLYLPVAHVHDFAEKGSPSVSQPALPARLGYAVIEMEGCVHDHGTSSIATV